MQTEIRAIGSFFKLNEKGQLINPANLSFLSENWANLLEQIIQLYQQHYKDQLHSVYLRGSLTRGAYVAGISDVDVVGLIKKGSIRWEEVPFKEEEMLQISEIRKQGLELELMVSCYEQNLIEHYPELAMILKTQAVCIWGTDILPDLPHFYPDQMVLIHYRWLEQDLRDFFNKKEIRSQDRKAIHKMLIRCGGELVVERSGQFTLDLYPAVQVFGRFYPNKKAAMRQVLYYFLNPEKELQEQVKMIKEMGNWLLTEIKEHLLF